MNQNEKKKSWWVGKKRTSLSYFNGRIPPPLHTFLFFLFGTRDETLALLGQGENKFPQGNP
jgi:hypothetical protein